MTTPAALFPPPPRQRPRYVPVPAQDAAREVDNLHPSASEQPEEIVVNHGRASDELVL